MPPPDYCNKVNTRSANNQACDNGFESPGSEKSISEQFKSSLRSDTVGIVKSLLGPSLEDAVLRTLEFGRSLMQKSELQAEQIGRDKKLSKKLPKEITECSNGELNLELLTEDRNRGLLRGNKDISDEKEKLLALAGKLDREELSQKPSSSVRKLSNVSKIRSLDSDLKQSSPSPEKIKKQLQALIQINKDEPTEHSWHLISGKTPKFQTEMTVMPSLCVYKAEAEMNCSSSCDVQSQVSKAANDCDETTSRMRATAKKRHPNKICQAPEFLSNALGPTIDVSIIDNLKMMRDIFKNDSGKGEGIVKEQQMKQEVRLQNSEGEMTCRIEELQKKIEELEQKEQCLIKQIEEEEHERESKRRAFQEEENRLAEMKVCMETVSDGRKSREMGRSLMDCNYDSNKFESLQQRIATEEEKLSRLKSQHEQYKRELAEAKCRKEALKKNKCLLDAWDIFASRVCHTRLPSFSRAYDLERKEFKNNDDVNLHCCFPTVNPPHQDTSKSCCQKSSSRLRSRSDHSESDVFKEQSSRTNIKGKIKMGEIQFPIQRDIVCGLHQMLKTCACTHKTGMRAAQLASSEDDMLKKCRGAHGNFNKHYSSSLGIGSSAELLMRDAAGDKHVCRSKSDTSLKNEKCSRIVKVMWAVTRINIFQNNYRTYEIMDATCTPPPCPPAKTEGIFVVKSSQKKHSTPQHQRKCNPCTAEFH